MADLPKPGSFVHVEFTVKDPAKVKKFYGDLFGWKFQDLPEMNYMLFEAPSGPGGGIGKPQAGQAEGVMNYLLVASVDDTMAKIKKAGGKILGPKQDVPGFGIMAFFEDPAGMKMALWQPSPESQRR